MFGFLLINTVFLLQIVARLFGVLKRAVNVRFVRSEKCASAVPPPPVVRPPSAPAQESGTSVKKKTRCSNANDEACATVKKKRSDLNGPTDNADTPKTKPAEPDKPSASVRSAGAASGKPKATFGGMKAGFLLQSPKAKKPQPKKETAEKADSPNAVKALPDQKLKNTASAGQKDPTTEAAHPKPRQKKEDPPQTPSAGQKSGQRKDPQTPSAKKSGKKQAQSPRPTSTTTESGQTPSQSSSSETIPIIPVLAHVRPILLPVPGTNQASLIWDGSRKARNFLAMIIAARRAAGL
ncbi:uncharacterized protein LOC144919013 isoform X1 [Branchiostoma floridae x Branchiostoma belcheri]